MAGKLNVLVLETDRGAADAAVEELTAAGHQVLRCHDAGAPSFPCRGVDDTRQCPFDTTPVDVALTVRSRPRSQPSPLEDGVSCALRRHVPLVVAGPAVMNPYEEYAAEVLDRTYDVTAAVERAAGAPLPTHGARAADALAGVLAVHGVEGCTPKVTVHRHAGRLSVSVEDADGLDHAVKSVASVRIIGALRELDRDAAGIDVVFEDRGARRPVSR
ncbi:MAG: hypothetical protein KatS3mg009_0449 [Acidimicrobiia bacterium]|nr:MAG: hypothetical protein KatS3mg009_0449 [Acidimicrobiia bacterium]